MTDKMKFGDFEWPHNPEKIQISYQNNISTTLFPFRKCKTEITAPGPRVVTGNGRFTGDDALFYASKLCNLKNLQAPKKLKLPLTEPFDCVLSKTVIFASASENAVLYEFEFIEADSEEDTSLTHTVDVKKGDSVYSISARTGVSVDRLLKLNPAIRDPFNIPIEKVVI